VAEKEQAFDSVSLLPLSQHIDQFSHKHIDELIRYGIAERFAKSLSVALQSIVAATHSSLCGNGFRTRRGAFRS
jgi:hypothetical protein